MKNKKIFICFPLSSNDKEVVKERVKSAKEYCLKLVKQGHIPFSPALVGLDLLSEIPQNEHDITFASWKDFCYGYLEHVDEVHVLQLKGWHISKGVYGEIEKAKELGKIINYKIF